MFLEGAVERILLGRVMAASHGLYTSFPAFGYESQSMSLARLEQRELQETVSTFFHFL
jgi:hypothetical protein